MYNHNYSTLISTLINYTYHLPTDSLPGEFYSYLTPKNKIILSNDTSLSYSFYYIAVSNNDTLHVVSYPSSHNSTAISVTYNGLPSEVLDKLSVTLALESDSGVINGSEVTANITIIGESYIS